ncbi:MAG TPA: DUF350 domain-containing protein [Opitutaceae bacterium]|jgi:uncharacterized membrane protein YjfL (UPF0719 family)|nr:MAG: hypothetical protein BWX86_00433 [Verrucomicrobia bacterium ADurb.Bin122]HOF10274.1 DUF350 domain-containing protein [Opitutaceae bacterium]HOR25688.1 DUF350 domain-containing protein [Opitutaceae bacterium]HOY54055.1 DUF350 domain-containing protein [Opitutaceae bacterium]HPG16702.1 DUF350 domain-containing protein [Opitutaceae bacterium]
MKNIIVSRLVKSVGAGALALALPSAALAAEGTTSSWAAVGGSLGGLLLGVIQLVVGLSLAAFSITKGLQLLSKLLGGLDIWAEVKNKNVAVALLAAGVVVAYTRVIAGGIGAMSDSLATLGTGSVYSGVIGLVSGVINLFVAIAVASFAITVVFRVMDKLTTSIDEKAEFKGNNAAIGALYCGIMIGVSSLVAAGVSGIGSGVSLFLNALINAVVG